MKHARLFLFISLGLSMFAHADPPSEVEEQQSHIFPYIKDLEELGYCVIPNVLPTVETQRLYERVWLEFIEKAWPNCKMDDRSSWKEAFPIHNKFGVFAGPAGQTQVMWDLRQDPRIIAPFAKIWNTNDLIVSMDGLSFMCPPEIREGSYESWPHVDQGMRYNNPPIDFVSESSLRTNPYTIQGQFLFEDSFEGDGGFYCIPKSHLRFNEFAREIEALHERGKSAKPYLLEFFKSGMDNAGNTYCMKHVTATRGSLILWDSRTVHWNQHPQKDRAPPPKVRMVGYVCYVPKSRLTKEGMDLRKEAFEKGVSTGHNPSYPELKFTKDHIAEEFKLYLEDPSYIQPKIQLTELGESLLGHE